MNQVDICPIQADVDVFDLKGLTKVGKLRFLGSRFEFWFNQVVTALTRPTVTTSLSFPATAAQNSSDLQVTFPKGTVALTDIPCLQTPAPPANGCYTCHIKVVDQVVVRFNNYSSGTVTPSAGTFSITVLKQ